jgi:uncharacterized protein
VIADTGPVVAWLNAEDEYHSWACTLPQQRPWLTVESCLAEAAWNLQAPRRVAALVDLEFVKIVSLDSEDWQRIAELAAHFADHEIDLVDFALVRLSEKFPNEKLATVDRAHFSLLRRFRKERLPLILPE